MAISLFHTQKVQVAGLTYEQKNIFEYHKILWWVSSVSLVAVPFVFIVVIGICKGDLNLSKIIGEGELILASFSISAPMVFEVFAQANRKDKESLYAFILSIGVVSIQILLYTCVKMSALNFWIGLIISLVTTASAIFSANIIKNMLIIISINESINKEGDENV